jgi:acyl-CoA thioester hydrolase
MNAPEGFRHAIEVQTLWGDMDALGHINNAKYLTYLESARIRYSTELGMWKGGQTGIVWVMVRVVIDYKAQLKAELVTVYTRFSRLGNKSADFEQVIVRQRDGVVAATCTTTAVAYDQQRQESILIPDDWRASMLAYESGLNS